MPTENASILRINDVVTAIGPGQICIEPAVDPDIGVKAMGYKDHDGNARKALVKGENAKVKNMTITSLASDPGPLGIDATGKLIKSTNPSGITFEDKGEWSSAVNYALSHVVNHSNLRWISRTVNINSEPSATSTDWTLLTTEAGVFIITDEPSFRYALGADYVNKIGFWICDSYMLLDNYLVAGDEYEVLGRLDIIANNVNLDSTSTNPAQRPRFTGSGYVLFDCNGRISTGIDLQGPQFYFSTLDASLSTVRGGISGFWGADGPSYTKLWQYAVLEPLQTGSGTIIAQSSAFTAKQAAFEAISPAALQHDGLKYAVQNYNYFQFAVDTDLGEQYHHLPLLLLKATAANKTLTLVKYSAYPLGGGHWHVKNVGTYAFTIAYLSNTVVIPGGFDGDIYVNSLDGILYISSPVVMDSTQLQANYGVVSCGAVTYTGNVATLASLVVNLFDTVSGVLQLKKYTFANLQVTIDAGIFTAAIPYAQVFIYRDQTSIAFALQKMTGSFVATDRATKLPLFILRSQDLTTINSVNYNTQFVANAARVLMDQDEVVGAGKDGFGITGRADLGVNIGVGKIHAHGAVRSSSVMTYLDNTDVLTVAAINQPTLYRANMLAVVLTPVNTISATQYNTTGATLANIPSNNWVFIRFFFAQDGSIAPTNANGSTIIAQYPQVTYATKADAIAGMGSEAFTMNPVAAKMTFIGGVLLQQGATATTSGQFFGTDKFGSLGGVGGTTITNPSVTTTTMGRATTYDFFLSDQNLNATSSFGTRVAHFYRLSVSAYINVERLAFFMGQSGGTVRLAIYKRSSTSGQVNLIWDSGNVTASAGFNSVAVGTLSQFYAPNDQLWVGFMVPQVGSGSFTTLAGRNLNLSVIGTSQLSADAVTIYKTTVASDSFPANFTPVVDVAAFPSIIPHLIASQIS